MIKLYDGGVYLVNGTEVVPEAEAAKVEALTGKSPNKEEAKTGTIAYGILKEHNQADTMDQLRIKFDAMASHDITFVGIVQTAKASGMEKFPLPYVLTNCHNTLCAVGGTINEDDHMFGLSAAKKYGGIYVPPHIAVIHQYMREMHAGCGKMICTMAIGEGGGELVKQLLEDTYDVAYPGVVAIYLDGKPQPFVGPQDIALAIIGAVFKNGFVKNKVMEFVGPGIKSMTTDYRNGVDVMTTETTCLSSIWETDEDTKAFLEEHGRGDDYKKLAPADVTYYDGCVYGPVHHQTDDRPSVPPVERLRSRRGQGQRERHLRRGREGSRESRRRTCRLHSVRQDRRRQGRRPAGRHRRLCRR